MVIADTNVWINSFRIPGSTIAGELGRLLRNHQIVMVGMVLSEILQGFRNQAELDGLRLRIDSLPFQNASQSTWVEAGRLAMDLRRRGVPIPLSDLIIAAQAMEGDHEIYTLDRHFQRIPGLRLYEIDQEAQSRDGG